MRRWTTTFAVFFVILPFTACHRHDHHDHAVDQTGTPAVAVTRWTERTELFMEYPVFVAGETGRSAIHITDLSDFSPLATGEVVVSLRSGDGDVVEFRDGPSRPGVFGVDLVLNDPGVYDMTLRVEAGDWQDLHALGPVTVYAEGGAIPEGEAGETAISFLKEQQWVLDFGTQTVGTRTLQESLEVPATVSPRAGGEAVLSSPVPGSISIAESALLPGSRVEAGSVLVRIVPRSDDVRDAAGLRAGLVEAEQDHESAVRERERVARLVESRALPERRLRDAEAEVLASGARHDAARERWARFESLSGSGTAVPDTGVFEIRAPFSGVIADARYAPGASVDQNQPLLTLVDAERVNVVAAVPEGQARHLRTVESGELLRSGSTPASLGKPLAIGRIVEPRSRTVDVRFALDNREPGLQVGSNVAVRLFFEGASEALAVAESAIVDDAGQRVVYVQTGGESFERRTVTLGGRAGGYVHVLEGLAAGDRVVHRGAYLIRLAALSPQEVAHGHVH